MITVEPWMILRCPGLSVFIYAMPKGGDYKKWPFEILEKILKKQVEVKSNSSGKPCLPHGLGYVNWSNSKGECILAYSKECEVGIDLEFHRERNFEAISKRFFAGNEITSEAETFYSLWTKKEAYYKCMGGEFFATLKNNLYTNAKIWHLQGPYKEKHDVAICISYGARRPPLQA
ncbi:MAG: 4'-phosphopantetheinyl transferase superfamily protein [Fibromonadaceae bacterium]|jgi:hypothetical protein|nr:4'-phosphopantetheinyl transferase superfamily protein [Fibromonadaceae bacterium]